MPEYLAPGVYIEEIPNAVKPIAGVDTSADGKYVNARRYLAYLESSIDRGLKWAVFELNNEATWAKVRGVVSDFLLGEWCEGGLQGVKPDEAFFVRCDRTTMTQADLDHGRLIALIGVALVKPAEFVILRTVVRMGDPGR